MTGKSSWFKIKPRDGEEERMKQKEYAERIESEDEREKNQKSEMETKKTDPKAVMFVPFTPTRIYFNLVKSFTPPPLKKIL